LKRSGHLKMLPSKCCFSQEQFYCPRLFPLNICSWNAINNNNPITKESEEKLGKKCFSQSEAS
jgi:hypothetical protein